jgi:hypothetical protein
MYDVPSMEDLLEVVIDGEVVAGKKPPVLVRGNEPKAKEKKKSLAKKA